MHEGNSELDNTRIETLAQTPDTLWKKSMEEGMKSYQHGHYAEAEKAYAAALTEAEKSAIGDLRLAETLSVLANVYLDLGRYGQAEPLYRRSLAIREKS